MCGGSGERAGRARTGREDRTALDLGVSLEQVRKSRARFLANRLEGGSTSSSARRRADLPQTPPLGPPQRHRTGTGHPNLINEWNKDPKPFDGRRPPTPSSTPLPHTAHELTTRSTRDLYGLGLGGLEVEFDQPGPAAFGWLDQCWTLAGSPRLWAAVSASTAPGPGCTCCHVRSSSRTGRCGCCGRWAGLRVRPGGSAGEAASIGVPRYGAIPP